MELPDNIRHMLEALRGGGKTTVGAEGTRQDRYGPPPRGRNFTNNAPDADLAGGMMAVKSPGFQLARMEAMANGDAPPTYAEYMKMKSQ